MTGEFDHHESELEAEHEPPARMTIPPSHMEKDIINHIADALPDEGPVTKRQVMAVIHKQLDRIVLAHDMLTFVLEDPRCHLHCDDETERTVCSLLDCLCWVLGHSDGKDFDDNMEEFRQQFKAQGIKFVRPV